jgi:thermitase
MPYQYKALGQTIELKVDPTVVAVRFQDDPPHSVRAAATERALSGPFAARFEIPGEKLTLVPTGPGPVGAGALSISRVEGSIQNLNAQPEVAIALPVFRVGANRVVTTDRLIIGLNNVDAAPKLMNKFGLRLVEARDDKIVCQAPDGAQVFDLVAAIDKEESVRFAEPDFVTIGSHIPKRMQPPPGVADPMIGDQYAMEITRAKDAWKVQSGDSDIRIAILDEGVDTLHPDLAASVVATYDATDNDSYQEPNRWDGHGTACAGLAAATSNNGIGIRGVGGGCSILAVRIALSSQQNGGWITTNSKIARAIKWSRENKAAVLSNSWGGGAPSSDISDEFARARALGRDGLGCVIVIAAGNAFGPVSFPGTLPDVITVSASNEFDEAKTPTSQDGEFWWGSNYGPEIDVAAPGVHNLTTDISGLGGGYAPDDYAPAFNGTSSATPLVAGACGLVLSAAPSLTEARVRELIVSKAEKVGQFPYANGRNDHMGSGRLNVLESVLAAKGAGAQPNVAASAPSRRRATV